MLVSEIELFEILSQQLGREKAKTLVEYVEAQVDKRLEGKTNVFVTKEDIVNLKTEIANSKVETLRWTFGFFITLMLAIIGLYFKH
jgi:hypothetical protein